jgi:putative flippase GtrA
MAEAAPKRTSGVVREFGGYGLASVAGLLTDVGLLALLVSVGRVHYLLAATISFVCGGAVVYALSVTWVFRFRRIDNRALELSYFVALGTAGLIVNAAVMYMAVAVLHLHFMFGKLLAAGCTFGTNFLLRRYFLFSPGAAARPRTADTGSSA